MHGRAALAEPVDVDDRDQVVEAGVAGLLEGLPHRALGQLGVAAEHPDPEVGALEPLAGERDPDRDRQALAERAGGDVDPGDLRRRVALQARAELAEGEQLLVVDRAGHLVHAVEQRRGVALGEDEVVVGRVLGRGEVVAQVPREQHRHQVGGRHRGGRVAGAGGGGGADRVDAQLLGELVQLLAIIVSSDRLDHAPRGREAIRSRPCARSASALARRSPPGTLTSNFMSRRLSRSFGRVIIFMYLQKAIRLASIRLARGAACWSGWSMPFSVATMKLPSGFASTCFEHPRGGEHVDALLLDFAGGDVLHRLGRAAALGVDRGTRPRGARRGCARCRRGGCRRGRGTRRPRRGSGRGARGPRAARSRARRRRPATCRGRRGSRSRGRARPRCARRP